MEIADLKTLIAVVEQGSITRAAGELHRVPSGVTARILQLEESLGVQLFLREKKRLLVTPKGRELYDYARKIVDLASQAEKRMKDSKPGGRFHIGALESTLASRLPGPLAKLSADCPELTLELTTGTSSSLCELLSDNRLDAVFVVDPPPDERVDTLPVFGEELVFIAPARHKPIHDPDDFNVKTVLAFTEGCTYRKRFLSWFAEYGWEPERIVELPTHYSILGGAAAGMGVGVVPRSVAALFPKTEAISIHPLRHPLSKAVTVLAWKKELKSANIAALIRCVKEQDGDTAGLDCEACSDR